MVEQEILWSVLPAFAPATEHRGQLGAFLGPALPSEGERWDLTEGDSFGSEACATNHILTPCESPLGKAPLGAWVLHAEGRAGPSDHPPISTLTPGPMKAPHPLLAWGLTPNPAQTVWLRPHPHGNFWQPRGNMYLCGGILAVSVKTTNAHVPWPDNSASGNFFPRHICIIAKWRVNGVIHYCGAFKGRDWRHRCSSIGRG